MNKSKPPSPKSKSTIKSHSLQNSNHTGQNINQNGSGEGQVGSPIASGANNSEDIENKDVDGANQNQGTKLPPKKFQHKERSSSRTYDEVKATLDDDYNGLQQSESRNRKNFQVNLQQKSKKYALHSLNKVAYKGSKGQKGGGTVRHGSYGSYKEYAPKNKEQGELYLKRTNIRQLAGKGNAKFQMTQIPRTTNVSNLNSANMFQEQNAMAVKHLRRLS